MKFICDAMLGKLARYLRILGLDAEYTKDFSVLLQITRDNQIPHIS